MARSRKRQPITGTTAAESDKAYKQAEHQRERAAVRIAVRRELEPPPTRDFGNPWQSEKDGKHFWRDDQDRARRK